MDCMDCHNRPTHTFDMPENAVNREMAAGRISPDLPFIHKEAIELLKVNYRSRQAAETELPEALREYYQKNYPAVYNSQRAAIEISAQRNPLHLPGKCFPRNEYHLGNLSQQSWP